MTAPPTNAIDAAGKRGVIPDEMPARQIYDDALARGWGFRGGLALLFGIAYEWGKLDARDQGGAKTADE